jgi:hypothetical protein
MARVSACPRTPSSPRPTVVFCTGAGCRKILDLPLHHSGYASCIHCGVEVSESSTNKQHTHTLGSKTRTRSWITSKSDGAAGAGLVTSAARACLTLTTCPQSPADHFSNWRRQWTQRDGRCAV